MLVAVLHSLLFHVIPHPSVSYRQVFIPILYFQPSSSQSDSRHFHFNFSWFFFHSFTASALALSGDFLPTGVFCLMLFPHFFTQNLLLSRFLWEPAVLPWSLQGFMLLILQNTDLFHQIVWFTAIRNLDIQKNSYLTRIKYYHELLVVKTSVICCLLVLNSFLLVQSHTLRLEKILWTRLVLLITALMKLLIKVILKKQPPGSFA